MPRGLVLGHVTLRNGTIDGGNRSLVGFFSSGLVTGSNGLDDAADGRADVRTLAGIETAMFFRLTGPFPS